jgi:hypothetical protein
MYLLVVLMEDEPDASAVGATALRDRTVIRPASRMRVDECTLTPKGIYNDKTVSTIVRTPARVWLSPR